MTEKSAGQSTMPVVAYAWVILVVVYLASVVAPLNQFKVPPILPLIMQNYAIDLTQAGLLMSSIALVGLILALPAGIILQKLGTKTTGLIALVCIAGGSALGALSSTFETLMASRVVEGVGIGLIGVVAPATIAMWFPLDRQGTPMGIWATWVPVGSLAMFIFAPALAVSAGWQAVWWAGTIFSLIMGLVFGLLIRKPPVNDHSPQGENEPIQIGKALANRDLWLLAVSFMCFNLALIPGATFYPTFLNLIRGYSLNQASLVASTSTIVVLFSAPLAGWISDLIGSRRVVISLPFLVIGLTLVFQYTATGWQIPMVLFFQGLFIGAIPTAIFAATPEIMRKPQWVGMGLSVVLLGQYVGQLFGPVLFGQFVESLGWTVAGYLMIPICLVGFISGWMIKIR